MSQTLIHLVSKERMQNLLPLLAIKPSRVVQICSNDHGVEMAARHTEAAAKEAGIDAEFQIHRLRSQFPSADEVRHAHKQLISIFPESIVNLTGGTKLMSLGAFLGASEFHGVPIIYCDTMNKVFIQVGKECLPSSLLAFDEVAATLTVPTVMAVHGKAPAEWRFDTASLQQLEFGRTAWNLRTEHEADFSSCKFGEQVRSFYRSDRGRIPSSADKLRALAVADLTGAFPGDLPASVNDFLEAAAVAGFLERVETSGYRIANEPSPTNKLRSHVERIANLLDGSWLELAMLSFLVGSKRYLDAHWSVEPTTPAAEAAYGETDLLAVHVDSSSLEIISCKTALKQPLEHLECLRTRADNLGGSHARASLAILHAGNTYDQDRLRRWGRLLRVNVHIGNEISVNFSQ